VESQAGCDGRRHAAQWSAIMRRLGVLVFAARVLWPGLVCAEDAKGGGQDKVDTEHIFGFTEGTDIGEKGEKELENNAVLHFGKHGNYAALENETSFRYGLTEDFRVSLGALVDYHIIDDVPDLADRHGADFSGLTSEFRWHVLERSNSPIGLAVSLAPQWRRVDGISGQSVESYALPVTVLTDAAIIPNKLFTAFNLTYEPSFIRTDGAWQQDNFLEVSGAASYAFSPDVFVGAEIRHLNRDRQGLFAAHGLYVGPSVFVKLSETMTFKVAWSAQIADETTHRFDLSDFERHQVLIQLVKSF
jgi:hypothetical protein